MSYRFDPKENHFVVWHCKRHPITKQPVTLRRKGFKTEAEARREERKLVIEVEEKLHGKLIPKWAKLVEP